MAAARAQADGQPQEAPPEFTPPTPAELRLMFRAFKNAKDKWQIDSASMKCFYLHSESGYLYIWHQATGILYEYEQSTGQCQTVWTSAMPQVNAELWTVLPLPPTDPASLQASFMQSEHLPNIDVFLVLTVAHESGHQVPADVLEAAVDDFCARFQVEPEARRRLCELAPAGQGFVIQNFRGDTFGSCNPSKALISYLQNLRTQRPPPWGNSACTLRVEATGAIIGRCCPDLDALCRQDAAARLAQAHCKIISEQDRFFVCDMGTSEEGTLLDGFALNEQWVGPLKSGSLLTVGPLRIRIELSDMAKDAPLEGGLKRPLDGAAADEISSGLPSALIANGDANRWREKVFQRPEEGTEDRKRQEKRRHEQYKDRAEERRKRTCAEPGSAAVDGLIGRFERIQEAERLAAEVEEARVDAPTKEAHREGSMNIDGSFLGAGGMERAGIGFHTAMGAELIPDVLDPKNLSAQDSIRLKTQLRFKQSHSR